MTLRAVDSRDVLHSHEHWNVSTPNVLLWRYGFEVVRIDAMAHPTKMICDQTLGVRTLRLDECNSVREFAPEQSVSVSVASARPQPARLGFLHEVIKRYRRSAHQ